jgi:hypothetical protein
MLAGCGVATPASSARQIDRLQVESLVAQRARERSPGIMIGASSCPTGVVAEPGQSFQCAVLVQGQPVRYEVKVASVDGSRVRYELRPLQPVIRVEDVVDFVRSLLEESWQGADIDCGPAQQIKVVDVGAILDCVAFTGTGTRYFEVEVEDRDGALSLRER